MTYYKIVRRYESAMISKRTIAYGLTREEAEEWCGNFQSSSRTCTNAVGKARTRKLGRWFDCFEKQ